MQAVVKMPRTKPFTVQGETIPDMVLSFLRENGNVEIIEDDDELIDVTETDWYKNIKTELTPAENVRFYRMNREYTLSQLGEKLGGLSRQNVSDIEQGRRAISKEMAHKLAKVFSTNYRRFL